jgi:hypothetical protein
MRSVGVEVYAEGEFGISLEEHWADREELEDGHVT